MPEDKNRIPRTGKHDYPEEQLSLETIICLQRLLAGGIPEEAPYSRAATERDVNNDVSEAETASDKLPGRLQNRGAIDGGRLSSAIASPKKIEQNANGFASRIARHLYCIAERLGKTSGYDASVKRAA